MYCTVLQRIRQIQKPIAEVAKGTSVIGIDRLVILLLLLFWDLALSGDFAVKLTEVLLCRNSRSMRVSCGPSTR